MVGTTASVPVICGGGAGASCHLTLTLSVVETLRGGKVIAVIARAGNLKAKKRTVLVGSATITLSAGQSATVRILLNGAGRQLLASHHTLTVRLAVGENGYTVGGRNITFRAKAPAKRKK
jgi:hypothetical protein